jgi:hypothetical protein
MLLRAQLPRCIVFLPLWGCQVHTWPDMVGTLGGYPHTVASCRPSAKMRVNPFETHSCNQLCRPVGLYAPPAKAEGGNRLPSLLPHHFINTHASPEACSSPLCTVAAFAFRNTHWFCPCCLPKRLLARALLAASPPLALPRCHPDP